MDPQLKNPTTWKSSLALDMVLPGDIKASVEGILKEDIHVVTLTNIGLKSPTSMTSTGTDGVSARPFYSNGRYDSQITDAYLINNVSGLGKAGQYYSITAKLEKNNWHGLSANVAYTYSNAKVIIDGVGDQPGSAWKALVSQRGTNNPELGYASYVMPHRVLGNISYSVDYAKFFGTTVSLSYYGGPTGRNNSLYVSNVYGDGAYNYSLIDIPTQAQLSGWTFKDFTDKEGNVTYSADDQKADFEKFIQQDA
jgi:hypothetical protein